MELAQYQTEALRFFLQGSAMLADEPGVGKTLPAIAALRVTEGPRLCVAPAHLQYQWVDRLKAAGVQSVVHLADGTKESKQERLARAVKFGGVVVCSYHLLGAWNKKVDGWRYPRLQGRWGAVVMDEAHILRSRKARWTKAAFNLSKGTDNLWLLTGTPEVTNAGDWYVYARLLKLLSHNSYWRFVNRHCRVAKTPFGDIVGGLKDPAGFHVNVLRGRFLRRKLTDPALGLDLKEPVLHEARLRLGRSAQQTLARAKHEYRTASGKPMEGAGEVAHYMRQVVAMPPTGPNPKLDYLKQILCRHENERVLILCWYRPVRDFLIDTLSSAACAQKRSVFGVRAEDHKVSQRRAIEGFKASKSGILVGSLPHLKEGVDGLQVASVLFLYTQSYVYTENEQAIARLARRGQEGVVHVYRPIVEKSIDVRVHMAQLNKKRIALKDLLEA